MGPYVPTGVPGGRVCVSGCGVCVWVRGVRRSSVFSACALSPALCLCLFLFFLCFLVRLYGLQPRWMRLRAAIATTHACVVCFATGIESPSWQAFWLCAKRRWNQGCWHGRWAVGSKASPPLMKNVSRWRFVA